MRQAGKGTVHLSQVVYLDQSKKILWRGIFKQCIDRLSRHVDLGIDPPISFDSFFGEAPYILGVRGVTNDPHHFAIG